MKNYHIHDKKSLELYLNDILFPCYYERKKYKKEVASYSDSTADFEQFSRYLLGVTAYLYNNKNQDLLNNVLKELKKYIDPLSESYIEVQRGDYSQIYVEMFAPLFFLYTFRKESDSFIQDNLGIIDDWFSRIFYFEIPDQDNWIWFQIIANCLLYKIGVREFDNKFNSLRQKKIDVLYKKEGYYVDGPYGEFDNYNSYAFFYYSVIYASLMENEDPINSQKHYERAKKFGYIYVNQFSDGGKNIPYGRSLTYKYGILAFAAAIVYSKKELLDYGYLKDLIFKSFNEWINQDIYREGGCLANGYYYENNFLLEDYNSYGSPYWAFKPFIMLLVDNDEFWNAELKNFSELKKDICVPNGIIKMYEGEQYFFPSINPLGYRCTMHYDKYEKAVYSTLFGFNISRGFDGKTVSADNTVTVSYDKKNYMNRSYVKSDIISSSIVHSQYKINSTEFIQYDFIQMPYILRIYIIDSKDQCYIREGAYAVNAIGSESVEKDGWRIIKNKDQCSGIKSISLTGIESCEQQISNTNVYYRRSIVPVCNTEVVKGKSVVATLIFGSKNEPNIIISPEIVFNKSSILISFGDIQYKVDMNEKYRDKNVYCKIKMMIRRMCQKTKQIIKKILFRH